MTDTLGVLDTHIIGMMLIDPETISYAEKRVSPEDFSNPWVQRVYEALLVLDRRKWPVDLPNLGCLLRCSVRDTWDIAEWTKDAPSPLHFEQVLSDWINSARG